MSNSTVWFYDLCDSKSIFCQNFVQSLSDNKLDPKLLDNNFFPGPGIILVNNSNDQVLERIEMLTRRGFERVCIVVVHPHQITKEDEWNFLGAGASDIYSFTDTEDPTPMITSQVKRWIEIDELLGSNLIRSNLVGRSRAWIATLREISEVARFTNLSMIITGESGTGKELVARMIHALDSRLNKRGLVLLDCTTVSPELSGSEFFGHERGSFTGAQTSRDGVFALADGGTLFLDEVGELPLKLQAELLRVIQEGTYKRIGSNEWKKTNFRLICATNRNLHEERSLGNFRDDLYHRLANWSCNLPSLSKRREDIPLLVNHFIKEFYSGKNQLSLDPAVWDYLYTRDYPGNVRELKHVVTRLVCRQANPKLITIGAIPEEERNMYGTAAKHWPDKHFEHAVRVGLDRGKGLDELRNALVEIAYMTALEVENWDTAKACERLKVTKRAVQMYVKKIRDAGAGKQHSSISNSMADLRH